MQTQYPTVLQHVLGLLVQMVTIHFVSLKKNKQKKQLEGCLLILITKLKVTEGALDQFVKDENKL